MNRQHTDSIKRSTPSMNTYQIMTRLDESLPLETEEWQPVEQVLMRLTEFAPKEMLVDLTYAIAEFADDQARRGYILGQEDMAEELKERAA